LSPPPHIIGQIVEMGFAPQQARKALAETDTGINVEAALELLLAGNTAARQQSEVQDPRHEDDEMNSLERERERRRRRREGPSRSAMATPTADSPVRRDPDEIPFADQADKILAQASAVGLSVFSKANSLWNVGKERAQKIIDERAAAGSSAAGRESRDGRGRVLDGRPRWMMDSDAGDVHAPDAGRLDDSRANSRPNAERFADSDRLPQVDERDYISGPVPRHRKEKEFDLLGENRNTTRSIDTTYRSPARRKPQTAPLASGTASGRGSPLQNRTIPKTYTPPALKRRQYTRATPTQISTSLSSKEAGNSHFKLGAYGEASDAYTRALDALPLDHPLRVPLYTNRASAYLKQGNHVAAIDDCTKAIELVGLDYHPSKEEPLDGDESVKDIKLADGLIKALCKRAAAYEMGEKWKQAREDWETAMSVSAASLVFSAPGGANQRKMVSEGLARAAKMCDVLRRGGKDAAVKPSVTTSSAAKNTPAREAAARPTVKPKPAAPINPAKSVGVAAMRAAASALESEESLRFQLKNTVDMRISTWSKGKETNIRGLLASLDMVLDKDEALWKDIKRPGMAELITDKQLKIGYMKVIARLHPDKVRS
jgi:tetratricopeptide (TPR) repeat protein